LRLPTLSPTAQNTKPRYGKDTKLLKPEKKKEQEKAIDGACNFQCPRWRESQSGAPPILPTVDLPHQDPPPCFLISQPLGYNYIMDSSLLQSTIKTQELDILLWICHPPSLRYVLLLSLLSPCRLSLCAWEKEKRKVGVLLGQWHSWPLASRRVGCKL